MRDAINEEFGEAFQGGPKNKEYYNDIEKALGIDSKKIEKLLMEVKLKINT